MKTLALAFLAAALLPLRSYALDCPRMPEQARKDLQVEVMRGADVTLQANDGTNALARAKYNNDKGMIEFLLKHVAR